MGNDCRFKIPEECREFGEKSFDRRREVAKEFVGKFVERVATPKTLDESDEAWSQSIRRRFFEMCPADCYPLPDAPWNAKGEFIADVTWAEIDKEKRILLACEIEWGTVWHGKTNWSHVAEHFDKLMPIKSPLKVFIFSSDDPPEGEEAIAEGVFSVESAKERLEVSLKNYGHHLAGEVYIFIDFPRTHEPESPGIYRSFIWMAKEFGKQEVKLIKGPGDNLVRPECTMPKARG